MMKNLMGCKINTTKERLSNEPGDFYFTFEIIIHKHLKNNKFCNTEEFKITPNSNKQYESRNLAATNAKLLAKKLGLRIINNE